MGSCDDVIFGMLALALKASALGLWEIRDYCFVVVLPGFLFV